MVLIYISVKSCKKRSALNELLISTHNIGDTVTAAATRVVGKEAELWAL
jgi:hypothetical protein